MSKKQYDFSGYATKNNLRCSDGRVILKDAFKHNDQQKVPLVWSHTYSTPDNILGHAMLENREDGVYAYGVFNETEAGKNAKSLVQHGDITALSIHANQLKQRGSEVVHGTIREVSLVLAGANPGAFIDNVTLSHSEGSDEEAIIYSGEEFDMNDDLNHGQDDFEVFDDIYESMSADQQALVDSLVEGLSVSHADEEDLTVQEVYESMNEKQKDVCHYMVAMAVEGDTEEDGEVAGVSHADGETIQDIFDTMSEAQKNVCYILISEAINNAESDAVEHNEGGLSMKKNVFDQMTEHNEATLTHDQFGAILNDAKSMGSFREAVLKHATTYGIENIDVLFPDAKSNGQPEWLERETEWVTDVLAGCSKTPFSRVKSLFADMNFEEARARGYIKAHEKKETYFKASKRITNPQTVYVKQKLDRDDIIDVTDFDIVAMVRYQLRTLLNEELARAILIGDGRDASDDYKINEENIRPIWTDEALFSIKVTDASPVTDSDTAAAFVEKVAFAHKDYKGSGTPAMYMTPELHTRLLWIKDGMKRRLYNSDAELCAAMRVSKIVEVPHMEGKKRSVSGKFNHLLAIKVNLRDYNCGADKGGQIATFDDFDIDFNQYKYLMETRMSGALTKAYSAQVFEYVTTTLASDPEEELI